MLDELLPECLKARRTDFEDTRARLRQAGLKLPRITTTSTSLLIHAKKKDQSAGDKELVSALVQSYIENPRSVILAVDSATTLTGTTAEGSRRQSPS